jgi:3-hydroxyisobutyrate dehydrogenase-like beta-hydroxyacid dehydrogenase
MDKTIGFIGLGKMGIPMAKNLQKGGYQLCIYNRTPDKAKELVAGGAKLVKHPSDVLENTDIVITMVSDDNALEELVYGDHGLSSKFRKGVIHICMSTIAPATSKKLAKDHEAKGATYLGCTVSGRPEMAAQAKLVIYLAGEKNAKERVKPFLSLLGQKVFDLGDQPEYANVCKLAANFLVLSCIQSLAEALTFVQKNGLNPKDIGDIFTQTIFDCPIYKAYAPIVAEGNYKPGLSLEHGLKDIRLLKELAAESFVPMPFASVLHEQLITCMAKGWQDMDWSAIAKACKEDANVENLS